MRKISLALLAGAAAVAASGTAIAQGRQAPTDDLSRGTLEQRAAEAFGRMDVNNDGKLDAADREARRKAMFERADANGDGGLSYDEFANLRGERPEGARAGRFGMRGERMGRRGMRGAAMGMRGMGRHADADSDGAITQSEFTGALLARFDAADGDGDGVVTPAERKAQRDARREQRRERRAERAS